LRTFYHPRFSQSMLEQLTNYILSSLSIQVKFFFIRIAVTNLLQLFLKAALLFFLKFPCQKIPAPILMSEKKKQAKGWLGNGREIIFN